MHYKKEMHTGSVFGMIIGMSEKTENSREELRYEAVFAAGMLGIVKAHGWMEMPLVVDVNMAVSALRAAGRIRMGRRHAITFARGLIDRACEVNGMEKPSYTLEEEDIVATLLGEAYDEIATAIQQR